MAKLEKSIVIVGAKRTAFGTMQGTLKGVSATDLGVHAAKAALAQSGIALDAVGHVIFGNVMQTSVDAIYCARHIGLKSGLPITTRAHHRAPRLRARAPKRPLCRGQRVHWRRARPGRRARTTLGYAAT